MSKHNYRTCDVCEQRIGQSKHLRLKRLFIHGWILRMLDWVIVDYNPVTSGWGTFRVDICEPCWDDLKAELRVQKEEYVDG